MSGNKIKASYFIDKANQLVFRGDYVVYGRIVGDFADLGFGKVSSIECDNNDDDWSIIITIIALDYNNMTLTGEKINIYCQNSILKVNFLANLK